MKLLSFSLALITFSIAAVAADTINSSGNTVATPCPNLADEKFYQGWYNLTQPDGQKLRIHFYAASRDMCYYSTKIGHSQQLEKTVAATPRQHSSDPPAKLTAGDHLFKSPLSGRWFIITPPPTLLPLTDSQYWYTANPKNCSQIRDKIYGNTAYVVSDLIKGLNPTYSLPRKDWQESTFIYDASGEIVSFSIPAAKTWVSALKAATAKGQVLGPEPGSLRGDHGVEAYGAWLQDQVTLPSDCKPAQAQAA
ncbi:hypothetical protein FRB96_005904 [Tulasnella sp. 330]|nr:hypothetical protein FRB96_005904 [Tulasnella sp. 330]KAG8882593.1 hypothetical protein FRB98_003569 [Tulasnella sp. 332]KAG8882835.1 hypothetical protein FRB97_007659 [Tulasnella sp. 331]